MPFSTVSLALVAAASLARASSSAPAPSTSYNGLGHAPQMGWNTWNTFACDISEETILNATKALVSTGLRDLGYNYVLIDDCWQAPEREKDGRPKADPERFPRGLKPLVDEIHALGMKAGIYSSAGTHTCALRFGSLGYEKLDADAYAAWGFDYLKYDNCFSAGQYGTPSASFARYKAMSDALVATGRDIFYSLCNWGQDGVWNWASELCNSYRMSGDVDDTFNTVRDDCPATYDTITPEGYLCSVENIVNKAMKVLQKTQRGSWADLDMLEVGRGGMSTDEYITHFTLWAILKSPLILGNDLTVMDETALAILSNKGLLAMHQDAHGSGRAARRVRGGPGEVNVFKGEIVAGEYVVAVSNFSDEDQTVDVDFAELFRDDPRAIQLSSFRATDLWSPPFFPSHLLPSSSSGFGTNALPSGLVSSALKGVQVRAHGTRAWKFELKREGGETEKGGERERLVMQKVDL